MLFRSGGDAQDSTIIAVSNTECELAGLPTGWTVGDNICRPGGLAANAYYFSKVRYRSNDPLDSDWSNWSGFETSDLTPDVGDAYEGGWFFGQINDGGTIYNLIVAPILSGSLEGQGPERLTASINDTIPSNQTLTSNQVWGGPTTAYYANTPNLTPASPMFLKFSSATGPNGGPYNPNGNTPTGTGIGGYTDWYLPARYEFEILYRYLKPGTTPNGQTSNTTSGFFVGGPNPNSVPPLTSSYTVNDPGQTNRN